VRHNEKVFKQPERQSKIKIETVNTAHSPSSKQKFDSQNPAKKRKTKKWHKTQRCEGMEANATASENGRVFTTG